MEPNNLYIQSKYNHISFVIMQLLYYNQLQARPHITPENLAHVHHMMVFVCPTYSNIVDDGICSNITSSFFGCFGGEILGAWAVNGQVIITQLNYI